MREKVVLIGAGSAMFTRGLVADLIQQGWDLELGLVDTNPDALAAAEGLTRKMVEAKGAGGCVERTRAVRVSASTDRRDVLPGATVVVCTVGVGGRRAWEKDVVIPRRYGIYQPVGDSVMPGGTSRALRMIPAMVAVAEDVLDLAPEALFFNYGNPMAPVCRAIRKATGAPVVGLCHGVFHVGHYLAHALGVASERVQYTAVGMNHLTWFTEVRVDGQDAMPRLQQIAVERLARLPDAAQLEARFADAVSAPAGGCVQRTRGDASDAAAGAVTAPRDEVVVEDLQPFSWQLLRLFGAFPAVLDRHVTEFFPGLFPGGRYYGKTLGTSAYSVEDTIAAGDRIYAEMREQALSPEPLGEEYLQHIGGEQEQVVEIVDSIRRDARRIYSANLPNRGQVLNLPAEAVLESPAIGDGAGLRAIAQPPLPAGIAGTLATRLAWVETVVEAALEGSRDKFIQALILDGAVDSLYTATRLADELLAAHAEYLPRFQR